MSDINTFRYKTVDERLAESQDQLNAQAKREQEKIAYNREAEAQGRMQEYDAKRAKWRAERDGETLPRLKSLGEDVGGVYRDLGQIAPTNKPAASIQEFWDRYNTWMNIGREQAAKNALNKQYISMTAPKEGVIAPDFEQGKRRFFEPGEKYKVLRSGKTPVFPGEPAWNIFSNIKKKLNNTGI